MDFDSVNRPRTADRRLESYIVAHFRTNVLDYGRLDCAHEELAKTLLTAYIGSPVPHPQPHTLFVVKTLYEAKFSR